MSGIDSRIVIIGLPQVAAALNANAEQAIWITQAYVLGSTVALLLIGRVSDIVGRVRIYTSGFGVFTVGSLLVSLATDPNQVIIFRFIQGLGSAILFTNSAAMIVDATPESELGYFLGINQVAFRMGAMAGLTLSGIILTVFVDWRALFYINIPIGIFGTLWARGKLKEIARLEKGAPIDWKGFASFTVFISALLLALTLAAYGPVDSWLVILLSALMFGALAAFAYIELRHKFPLLDLKLMRIREFTGGVVAQLMNAVAFGAVLLLLSIYFQQIKDQSALIAGLIMIPLDITTVILGPLSGKLSDKYGHLPFTTGGLLIVSVSLFLFATTDVGTPLVLLIAYMMIFGTGMGIFASPNMSSIMGAVPSERRGIASAFRATFFNVGFVISLNLAILVMTFAIPFGEVSQIIAAANPLGISLAEKIQFASALRNAYLWMAVINTLAIVPSMMRGRRTRTAGQEATKPLPEMDM
jgi:EmrB/QacA subfamily drug resistance transporter